jgi:hypothetical protein
VKKLCILITVAAAALGFLAGRNAPAASTQTVTVAYPEQWNVGDWRECMTGANDVVTGLVGLDCDMHASTTPRSRFFDMSVRFSTKIPPKVTHLWQCQRDARSLVCD